MTIGSSENFTLNDEIKSFLVASSTDMLTNALKQVVLQNRMSTKAAIQLIKSQLHELTIPLSLPSRSNEFEKQL